MTSFSVERLPFDASEVRVWQGLDVRHRDWPVVYALHGPGKVYVGETLDAADRMVQHLASPDKKAALTTIRVVLDDTFNKSVCLDLESYLIRLFAGDGKYEVLNANAGITDRNYFDRARYRETFEQVFEHLRAEGLFDGRVRDIENSDLFKLSPFKALSEDQSVVVGDILDGLFTDLANHDPSTIVIQGEPGTGKTIVGIFLMKLLRDIQTADPGDEFYVDSSFAEFFLPDHTALLADLRIGLVVPQQSLRDSIRKVFAKTPGLDRQMVLTPYDVGRSEVPYDLLIVDEAHRLNQRANQSSGMKNREFADINRTLFGTDRLSVTQLDWIRARSTHQVFLLDRGQSVRPADLPAPVLQSLVEEAAGQGRSYRLHSQMRVRAGEDYVGYVRAVLAGQAPDRASFADYDLRLFEDLGTMRDAIHELDARHGLARLVAGFAWPWRTKRDKSAYDIEVDGCRLRWNGVETDWINSKGSLDEVGSIHTVQGYDLNYAGIIIGQDLRYDPERGRLFVDRASYHDKKGKENNPRLGIVYTDDDLLRFITSIYAVLLTRGMRGTFVYACDPALREYLGRFLPTA